MKNLKNYKLLGIIFVFLLCVLFHFTYQLWPNPLFSVLFPVNESIWEHMKLIFSSFVIYGIFEYLIIRKKVKVNNYLLNLFITPGLAILLYLTIYIPLYFKYGENMIISIGLLFIMIIIEELISYNLLKSKEISNGKLIGFIGIILMYFLFSYYTYNPTDNFLFYDILKNGYGILPN